MKLDGKLFSGMGVAADYLEMKPYIRRISEAAGFKPFPGTLNLKVDSEEASEVFEDIEGIRFDGFNLEGEVYSGFTLYNVEIEGIKAAYLDLDVTDYGEDVMEIVAPVKLREKLELEDGNLVTLKVL